jgi:integrase
LGAKTVREHLSFLLTALDFAVEEGDLEANAVRRKRLLPTAKPATVEWLEVDEIDVLLHAVGARLLPIVVVALDTGLRISELLGLRWRDVDLEARLVSVQHQLQRIDGRWQWERLKTDASTRVVPLGVRAHAGLVALHRTASAEPGDATRLLSNWSVFSDGLGRPIPYNTVSKRLRRVTRGLGWTRRGFHTLRHTYVSHQLRAGTDAKRLAQFTGHTDAGFLLRRYAHALRTAGRLPSYFDEIAPSWLGEVVGHDS